MRETLGRTCSLTASVWWAWGWPVALLLRGPPPHFCVADGLYRQTAPEFRVASSVEQLNTIEVGAQVAEGGGCAAGGPQSCQGEGAGLKGLEAGLGTHSLTQVPTGLGPRPL